MRTAVIMLLVLDCLLLVAGLLRDDDAAPAQRAPAPLPLGVEPLRLLSEVADGRASTRRAPAPVATADDVCLSAGPLPDAIAAEAVLERARSLGHDGSAVPVEIAAGPPDLQVHLPPLPSAEQASRAVREFAALDIEAYVIPDGELAGGVSLGTFTAREAAEARRAEVAQLGYPVRIVEIPRMRRVWDVRLRSADPRGLDGFLATLRADWPELAGERVACDPAPRPDGPAAAPPG